MKRYCGYYYDTETGFYYLQSRYYDPNACWFIYTDGYSSTTVWIYPGKDQNLLDEGWELIGDIHTHPGPKSFSDKDIEYNEEQLSKDNNFVAFVGTTRWELYRYDNTGESYVSRFSYKVQGGGKKPIVVFVSMKM